MNNTNPYLNEPKKKGAPEDAPYIYFYILGDRKSEMYYNTLSAQAWGIDQGINQITKREGAQVWSNPEVKVLEIFRWNTKINKYEPIWNSRRV